MVWYSKYERELLPAFDGNSVVLDWASEGSDLGPASPIVVVLHGILGSAEENYCRNVVKLCLKRGCVHATVPVLGLPTPFRMFVF